MDSARPKPPNAGKGRPKGAVNKTTREVREFARGFLESPEYVASCKARVLRGKAPHLETLLFHYAYGKPKDQVEHSGEVALPTRVIFELHRND